MSTIEPAGDGEAEKESVIGYASQAPPPLVAVVWCRILALWMLAWGLYQGATFLASISMMFRPTGPVFSYVLPQVVAAGIVTGIWLLMAWYCWRKAPKLARKMAEGTDPSEHSRPMSSHELLGIIVVGIGIYMLADGLPTLSWVVWTTFEDIRNGPAPRSEYDRAMVSAVVRCALGIWFILGTGGLVERVRGFSGRWRDEVRREDGDSQT